jgi:cell division protein FtsZ
MGILTVAVVTKPFAFEGKRTKVAQDGLEELSKHVDSLIVIPNEKLMQVLGEDVPFLEAFRAANDVLHNAVAGIAEIINCPGLVNVDFADVRTVMSEMGMAMMGSALASGPNRARIAAEQAVASPLLEDVNLANARGVLVNITASPGSFKMKEYYDVMNTIKEFTAEDATVIIGNVFDESIGDCLRVTMVATGLTGASGRRQQKPELRMMTQVRDGTTNQAIFVGSAAEEESPAVFTSNGRRAQVEAMKMQGVEEYDIPAFLRKQAD